MLLELTVENIAIIDRASLSLGPGFTALTGETGAGKSLLVDAIGLALGGRADSDLVRTGARKGTVTLLADLSRSPAILARCAEFGVDMEDGQLAVQREVSVEGRSNVRLNGRPASVGVLREIGAMLVDLHGQHDHQALLAQEKQVDFFDAWIGEAAWKALAEVQERHHEWEALRRRLEALRGGRREREQRLDMLRFQVGELEALAPVEGEVEQLEARVERLRNAERLAVGVGAALALIADEGGAQESLGRALREVEGAVNYDPALGEALETLREATLAAREAAPQLRSYLDELESEPDALEQTAARLDALRRAMRKYGDTEAALVEYLRAAREELGTLETDDQDEAGLVQRLGAAEADLHEAAAQLTEVRRGRAEEFGRLVTAQIRELAMERAEFRVVVDPKPIAADGADSVAFFFTANPGDPPRPLARVASGGEISRVMLGIKVASAGRAGVPTLIFDEVDTGLSGRAAAVTARKLEELAQFYQVIVISHLPQIAGRAHTQFRIEKSVEGERARTDVRLLEGEERLAEVARLLAGEKVGESALANAREILARG
ncbi:MAG: DNA repair protein RecN [Fimbriimonadaceae bacterium]|nr:DNA repair protein RecN [Fimbriimonadaceae bacterium]QYK56037.1 MAG: DNA repair protein RecN [Fimbriimonadaceae bacterium]